MIHFRAMVLISMLLFAFLFISFGYLSRPIQIGQGAEYGVELSNIMYHVSKNYVDEIPLEKAFKEAASSIVERDDFSKFMPEVVYDKSKDMFEGVEVQVGLEYRYKPGFLEVISVDQGSSLVAQLSPLDQIVSVGGVEVIDMTRSDVSKKFNGKINEKLALQVRRPGVEGLFEINAIRKKIQKNPIFIPHFLVSNPNLIYMYLEKFQDRTTLCFREAYNKLLLSNPMAKGLILDLRGNPGGDFSATVEFAELFLKEGLIVATVGNENGVRNQIRKEMANPGDEVKLLPIVLLVDRQSASAAEMISSCLRDYGLAKIVGETTYGKGTAQSLFHFHSKIAGNYGFKLTTARYYTKSGFESNPKVSIQGVGVKPDVLYDFGGQNEYLDRFDRFRLAIGWWNYGTALKLPINEILEKVNYFSDLEKNDPALLKAVGLFGAD